MVEQESKENTSEDLTGRSAISIANIYLGAPQKPSSLGNFQDEGAADPRFTNVIQGLRAFLAGEPDGCNISVKIGPTTLVRTPFNCIYKSSRL